MSGALIPHTAAHASDQAKADDRGSGSSSGRARSRKSGESIHDSGPSVGTPSHGAEASGRSAAQRQPRTLSLRVRCPSSKAKLHIEVVTISEVEFQSTDRAGQSDDDVRGGNRVGEVQIEHNKIDTLQDARKDIVRVGDTVVNIGINSVSGDGESEERRRIIVEVGKKDCKAKKSIENTGRD